MKEINAQEAKEIFQKRGLELDDKVFEDVWKIIRDIKNKGDQAVYEYSQQFDGIGLKDTLVPAQWFEERLTGRVGLSLPSPLGRSCPAALHRRPLLTPRHDSDVRKSLG